MPAQIWPSMSAAMADAAQTAVAPLRWNPTDHLLSRCSFGPTQASRAYVDQHGPDAWYRQQVALATASPAYSGNPDVERVGPLLQKSPQQVRAALRRAGHEFGFDALVQLSEVTLGLQAWSKAQLFEVLVDFFANHLNVTTFAAQVSSTRHVFDRDVIRGHVTGTFTAMLLASAKSPAMLTYLNLADSTKDAVNENYGRELLELHTVGLNYTEADVENVATLLTGRMVDRMTNAYYFDPDNHPTGRVTVLGFTHPNAGAKGGEAAGDALLRYLAAHPDTANHLAYKLCVRLVSDAPSDDLVAAVAQAYLDNKTRILPMVETILRSTEFWESRGQKLRRPVENMIATVRAVATPVGNWAKACQSLHWMSMRIGQQPFAWQFPNGYPDVADAWQQSGALIQIWKAHLGFVNGWWDGMKAPAMTALYGGNPTTSGEAVGMLEQRLTGDQFSADDHAVLMDFLAEDDSTPMEKSKLRHLGPPLAAIILDGPHFALR